MEYIYVICNYAEDRIPNIKFVTRELSEITEKFLNKILRIYLADCDISGYDERVYIDLSAYSLEHKLKSFEKEHPKYIFVVDAIRKQFTNQLEIQRIMNDRYERERKEQQMRDDLKTYMRLREKYIGVEGFD